MFKHVLKDRLLLLLVLVVFSNGVTAADSISSVLHISSVDKERYLADNIQLLGVMELDRVTANGEKLLEFSGLAWDNDEKILYALSDRGFVVHLRPQFSRSELTGLEFIAYHSLLDSQGRPLGESHADSEGLTLAGDDNGIAGDTELIISFERIPRLLRYDSAGNHLGAVSINNTLADITQYRHENMALEAVTTHPHFGLLVGTEKPMPATGKNIFTINADQAWTFTASDSKHGSLVGMSSLANGRLVVLERHFPGIFAGITSSLYLLDLQADKINQQLLASFRPSDGLFNDNFEGIAWHRSNRFFMISDDNDFVIQRNLLLYFAIPDLDKRLNAPDKATQ